MRKPNQSVHDGETKTLHPAISIVTITKDNIQGIRSTLLSLKDQLNRDFEWIVIDGASKDDTVSFIRDQTLEFPTLLVSEPDTGIFNAMNKGLARASGRYIVFLNAGDQLASRSTVQTVLQCMPGDPSLIYGDSIQKSGASLSTQKPALSFKKIKYGMFACHQAIYYNRAKIGSLKYPESFRCSGDYYFTALFLTKSSQIFYVNEPLAIFDMAGFSETNQVIGRRENWLVQTEVLKLSWGQKLTYRITYSVTSSLKKRLPWLYIAIRFKNMKS